MIDITEDDMVVEVDEESPIDTVYLKIILEHDAKDWDIAIPKGHELKKEILQALEIKNKVDDVIKPMLITGFKELMRRDISIGVGEYASLFIRSQDLMKLIETILSKEEIQSILHGEEKSVFGEGGLFTGNPVEGKP